MIAWSNPLYCIPLISYVIVVILINLLTISIFSDPIYQSFDNAFIDYTNPLKWLIIIATGFVIYLTCSAGYKTIAWVILVVFIALNVIGLLLMVTMTSYIKRYRPVCPQRDITEFSRCMTEQMTTKNV